MLLRAYALVWLVWSGNHAFKSAKEFLNPDYSEQQEKEDKKKIRENITQLLNIASWQSILSLSIVLYLVVLAIDVLGYGLAISYMELDTYRQKFLYGFIIICLLEFIKMLRLGMTVKRVMSRTEGNLDIAFRFFSQNYYKYDINILSLGISDIHRFCTFITAIYLVLFFFTSTALK